MRRAATVNHFCLRPPDHPSVVVRAPRQSGVPSARGILCGPTGRPAGPPGASSLGLALLTQAPEDIADVVVFSCSDPARFVTGQEIVEDGGMTLHRSGVDGLFEQVFASYDQAGDSPTRGRPSTSPVNFSAPT
jgi:hypothetical protein